MLLYHEKSYIGVKYDSRKETKYPSAFLTPYGTDKSFENRKATVDRWVGEIPEGMEGAEILDNEPMSGFKIVDYQSRYTTDNKVFDVQDPRGFTLQIYAGNLTEIIQNSIIERGVILDKCVWMRSKQQNYLSILDDTIKDIIYNTVNKIKMPIVPGVVIDTPNNDGIVYHGPTDVLVLNFLQTYWGNGRYDKVPQRYGEMRGQPFAWVLSKVTQVKPTLYAYPNKYTSILDFQEVKTQPKNYQYVTTIDPFVPLQHGEHINFGWNNASIVRTPGQDLTITKEMLEHAPTRDYYSWTDPNVEPKYLMEDGITPLVGHTFKGDE